MTDEERHKLDAALQKHRRALDDLRLELAPPHRMRLEGSFTAVQSALADILAGEAARQP